MNIRVNLIAPIYDGQELTVRTPADCTQVDGLIVYYPEKGATLSKWFPLVDAHGNDVSEVDYLFGENAVIKVILDVTDGRAFMQNADSNTYLERRIDEVDLTVAHSYNDVQKKRARENIGVPTKVSELTNDKSYVSEKEVKNLIDSAGGYAGGSSGKSAAYFIAQGGWTRIAKLSENSVLSRFDISISHFMERLIRPKIMFDGKTLFIESDGREDTSVVFVNGVETAFVTGSVDLSTLDLPIGTYIIGVKSRGANYRDSVMSNEIEYECIPEPGLYDAGGNLVATWATLASPQREGGYGMNVTGSYAPNEPDWEHRKEGHPASVLAENKPLEAGTMLVIPGSVNHIAASTFVGCKLTDVIIQKGATRIEQGAFAACPNLKRVVIPSSVQTIQHNAFRGCHNLTEVTFTNGLKKIDTNVFEECPLASIVIPDSVESIGDFAFMGNKATSVTIPASAIYVGRGAFANSENMENIYVADGNPNYTNGTATDENGKLFNFIADHIGTTIVHYPTGCKGLRIALPLYIKAIGPFSFFGSSCSELIIPDNLLSIGDYAFSGSASLNILAIPQTVTYIGAYAFQDCSSLVGEWNEDIGDWMLRVGCDLEEIAEGMFIGCEALVNIYFEGDVLKIKDKAFLRCGNLKSISVADALDWIADNIVDKFFVGLFAFTFRGTREEWNALMEKNGLLEDAEWIEYVVCIPGIEE